MTFAPTQTPAVCEGGAGKFDYNGRTLRCIELGAGCGLPGLVMHALGHDVTLTDLAGNLPLLEANANGIFRFGDDPGAGNVVKVCGNYMIACAIESCSEVNYVEALSLAV